MFHRIKDFPHYELRNFLLYLASFGHHVYESAILCILKDLVGQ